MNIIIYVETVYPINEETPEYEYLIYVEIS